jgi:hypothetical protein
MFGQRQSSHARWPFSILYILGTFLCLSLTARAVSDTGTERNRLALLRWDGTAGISSAAM